MDWKVITINVFYVQLLKVDSCTNDDKSVPKILLSFSASINDFIFPICCLWENLKILMKIVSFFCLCPNNVLEFQYSQTCLKGSLYQGVTCLKEPPFWGPLNQNIVRMNLFYEVTCLKQLILPVPWGDPLRQV